MTLPGDQPTNPKAAAAAAKAYAKANRPWFKKKRFIIPIVLVALMILGGLAGGGGDSTDPTPAADTTSNSDKAGGGDEPKAEEPKAEEKPKPKPEDKAVKVEATALIKAFEENELAADEQYKDKDLEVTGRVNKIDTDLFDGDKYVLRIGGGGEFEILTVNCYDIPQSQLSKLSTGQKVTVVGEFDDGGDLGVELQECEVK